MANTKRRARTARTIPSRTISACLIVKDEEANLPRCLRSLAGKVDEIVVVDTGSSDRTVALAEEAGAKVFHFPWCDDFSAARNESLRHAGGSFILWIDADDELVEAAPGALRQLCAPPAGEWGWFVDVHCPGAEPGESVPVVRQWRLFPRAAGIRFEGRIHEHPAAPRIIRREDVRQQDRVHVVHWGYTVGGEAQQRKLERNRRLIEHCIADEPHQPRHYFNLGTQLQAEGRPGEGLRILQQGIDRWFQAHGADTGYVPGMFAAAAACALSVGQPQTALDIEARTPPQFVSSDLLYQAGIACRDLGRTEDAAQRWQRALTDALAIGNILSDRDCLRRAERELQALPPRPRISACLIVKNEETDLPRCLSSIRSEVDEIVVVDTGSTDRTVEIARAGGARTSFFEWCDDFSAARNYSLAQASGEVVLWVDADDELLTAQPGALRSLVRNLPEHAWAYWVDVLCPTDEWHEGETIVKQPRLFRRGEGIGFRGRLHEQLHAPTGYAPEALAVQDSVRIKHWGYVPQAGGGKPRSERNQRILAAELKEHPNDHFVHYKLALQFAGDKDFASALPAFERALELWRANPGTSDGHIPSTYAMAALAAVELRDYRKVLEIEQAAPEKYLSADLVYQAGMAWWELDDAGEAIARFDRALTDISLRQHNSHDSSTSSWRPLIMKAAVYVDQEKFELAYECASAALKLSPTRPDALYLLAHASNGVGRRDEAIGICRRILAGARDDGFKAKTRRLLLGIANDLDNAPLALEALQGEVAELSEAGAISVRARAYAALGDLERQVELLTSGCTRFPDQIDLRLQLSQVLESQGGLAEAAAVLSQAMDYPPVPTAVFQRLAVVLARLGRLEDAANALELAARAGATVEPELVEA